MNRSHAILFLIILITTACKQEQTVTEVKQPHDALDSLGNAIIAKGEHVGFSVAIMQGQDTIYNQGFGHTDTARTHPVSTDTRFLMASISKLIGSTLVMKLVEEEKLSLDQTLLELLPDFPNPEQAEKITLRHMISHTSGLQEYAEVIDSMYVRTGNPPTKTSYYDFFRGRELNFEPGTDYSYCNSGFVLMALAIERITGNSLQEEFNRVINKPVGLDLKH